MRRLPILPRASWGRRGRPKQPKPAPWPWGGGLRCGGRRRTAPPSQAALAGWQKLGLELGPRAWQATGRKPLVRRVCFRWRCPAWPPHLPPSRPKRSKARWPPAASYLPRLQAAWASAPSGGSLGKRKPAARSSGASSHRWAWSRWPAEQPRSARSEPAWPFQPAGPEPTPWPQAGAAGCPKGPPAGDCPPATPRRRWFGQGLGGTWLAEESHPSLELPGCQGPHAMPPKPPGPSVRPDSPTTRQRRWPIHGGPFHGSHSLPLQAVIAVRRPVCGQARCARCSRSSGGRRSP